ncbi:hypothetical protein A2188_02335 [Candidatus Woesebacteria bacterium RIFOXYA1_FULL_43_9]|uniref:Uncharacterized protein n=1 Tax=Candidatus Woesebacteria bacterium RIFOXYA1_FULL_43_9 TaxID=1802534 RepID=A0A1F8CMF2_9BACT|nr:MAG: hypothetical protein A2188_02335 [Candidatus Woesebacteria bacterium RIFOXYA1_FULL_43_9]
MKAKIKTEEVKKGAWRLTVILPTKLEENALVGGEKQLFESLFPSQERAYESGRKFLTDKGFKESELEYE